jgi:hypothetical protein
MECEKCKKTFPSLTKLERHLRRKTPCEPIIASNNNYTFKCRSCNRIMSNDSNLKRHYRNCSAYNNPHIVENVIENNGDNNVNGDKTVNANIDGDKNNLIVGDHNTINNYNGPITFNCFNMGELVDKVMDLDGKNSTQAYNIRYQLRALIEQNDPKGLIEKLVSVIHDNNEYPNGKNIYVGSPDGKYGGMIITFQDDKWVETGADQIAIATWKELTKMFSNIPDIDMDDVETVKCINTLETDKFRRNLGAIVIFKAQNFGLSKKNPTEKVVKGSELKKPVNVESDDEKSETDADDEKSDNSDNIPKQSKKTKQIKPSNSPKNKQPEPAYQEIIESSRQREISEDDDEDSEIAIKGNVNTMSARDTVEEHVNTIDDKREFEDFNSNENSEEEKPNHSGMPVFTNTELYFLKAVGRKVPDENKKIKKEIKRNK